MLIAGIVLCCPFSIVGQASTPTVYLTIGYCPTVSWFVWYNTTRCPLTWSQDFTSRGAVVEVNALNGNWKIVGTFEWPEGAFFGCLALYDPTVCYDSASQTVFLDVTDDFGKAISLSAPNATVVKYTVPRGSFFVGRDIQTTFLFP